MARTCATSASGCVEPTPSLMFRPFGSTPIASTRAPSSRSTSGADLVGRAVRAVHRDAHAAAGRSPWAPSSCRPRRSGSSASRVRTALPSCSEGTVRNGWSSAASIASSVASSSFSPCGREELDAVVVVRIVRGGDHDAAIGAQRARQVRDGRRRHRAHQLHVDAGGDQPGFQRGLEHVVGDARVLADDHHRLAPFALAARCCSARGRRRCPGAARSRPRSRPRRPGRGCRRCRNTCARLKRRPRRRPPARGCFIISASRCGDAVAHFAAVADLVDRAVLDQEFASAGSLPAASRARSARSRAGRRSRSAPPVRRC